jgi:hypothetical protein
MNACPVHNRLRADLPPLIPRIAALPVDERGYPVPFFVAWIEGKPDFRVADPAKLARCVKEKLCWVCGDVLGAYKTFTIGPMCAVNRTTAEPPEHRECAEWSVLGCPFLSRPNMVRREDETTAEYEQHVAGVMIKRNPGVIAIWTTKNFNFFPDGAGRFLIRIGEPEHVSWWREGRRAARAEIMASIETGLPLLQNQCRDEWDRDELNERLKAAMKFLPTL